MQRRSCVLEQQPSQNQVSVEMRMIPFGLDGIVVTCWYIINYPKYTSTTYHCILLMNSGVSTSRRAR